MPFSKPFTLSLRGVAPVATITSSASRLSTSVMVVLNLIVMPRSCISFLYHSIKALSLSLKSGADAAINTPPSLSVFSYIVTLCPLRASTLADSIPPIPPPITATFLTFLVGTILYFLVCIVLGFNAHLAIPALSDKLWSFATPL